jgi:hypothetical protein
MNSELLQGMIDIVFKGNLLFLTPFIFLLMVTLFTDRLVEFISTSIGGAAKGRRSRY